MSGKWGDRLLGGRQNRRHLPAACLTARVGGVRWKEPWNGSPIPSHGGSGVDPLFNSNDNLHCDTEFLPTF